MWGMDIQNQVEFKADKNKISAEWLIEPTVLNSTKFNCSLSGTFHNNSALVTYKKEPVDKTTATILSTIGGTTTYDCFAYIAPTKNEINIIAKDPKKDFSLRFYREST
jgi:hypothetical protein